jgi:hypothetical protein
LGRELACDPFEIDEIQACCSDAIELVVDLGGAPEAF